MSEFIPHVVSAIEAKRVEIAAQVQDTERKLAKLRAALANLDAAAVLQERFRNRRNHSLPQPMRGRASATVGRSR